MGIDWETLLGGDDDIDDEEAGERWTDAVMEELERQERRGDWY